MKMIASSRLAKAQRSMQSGKEYGAANTGVFLRRHPAGLVFTPFQ
jgi:F-type H+-transporting ATPase subunit gamma